MIHISFFILFVLSLFSDTALNFEEYGDTLPCLTSNDSLDENEDEKVILQGFAVSNKSNDDLKDETLVTLLPDIECKDWIQNNASFGLIDRGELFCTKFASNVR